MPGISITQYDLRSRFPDEFVFLLRLLTKTKYLNLSKSDFIGDNALPDNMPWKRLRVGSVTSQKIVYSFYNPNRTLYDVFIYSLKSKKDCRILMTSGPNNEPIRLESEYRRRVQFDKPFSDLDRDMSSDSATNKLRILTSAMFLVSGHIDTLYTPGEFFLVLREACYCIQHDGRSPPPTTPELANPASAKCQRKLPAWNNHKRHTPKTKAGRKVRQDYATDDSNPIDDDETFFVKFEETQLEINLTDEHGKLSSEPDVVNTPEETECMEEDNELMENELASESTTHKAQSVDENYQLTGDEFGQAAKNTEPSKQPEALQVKIVTEMVARTSAEANPASQGLMYVDRPSLSTSERRTRKRFQEINADDIEIKGMLCYFVTMDFPGSLLSHRDPKATS